MTIIELINNWCPRSPKSRTFLIPYSDGVFDKLCDFIWGESDPVDFYKSLEVNCDICIDHDYTTCYPDSFLSDKYLKAEVKYYSFYRHDLFIIFEVPDQ